MNCFGNISRESYDLPCVRVNGKKIATNRFCAKDCEPNLDTKHWWIRFEIWALVQFFYCKKTRTRADLGSISSTYLCAALTHADSKSAKSCFTWLSFCAFGICVHKSCLLLLVKLIPGVNFINMFMRSFYYHRPRKRKKLLELTVFFGLLGFASVKVAREIGP